MSRGLVGWLVGLGRGESRFRLDGGGWSDERKEAKEHGEGGSEWARARVGPGVGKPGNGKGGWRLVQGCA